MLRRNLSTIVRQRAIGKVCYRCATAPKERYVKKRLFATHHFRELSEEPISFSRDLSNNVIVSAFRINMGLGVNC